MYQTISLIWCSATPVGSCNIYFSKKSTLSILLGDSFLHGPGLNNFATFGCVFFPYSWKMMEVNYNVEILLYILSFVKRARHGTRR
ncbi:hypothetical protein NC651_009520 [Populus alba x Populus x berolinensis]|nr:hypothetical protein NC651_009520 [Populus alba x Populus x berolinensis]